MFELSGYKIDELIYKSEKSSIYKGTQISDNKRILVKLQNSEYPTKEELIN